MFIKLYEFRGFRFQFGVLIIFQSFLCGKLVHSIKFQCFPGHLPSPVLSMLTSSPRLSTLSITSPCAAPSTSSSLSLLKGFLISLFFNSTYCHFFQILCSLQSLHLRGKYKAWQCQWKSFQILPHCHHLQHLHQLSKISRDKNCHPCLPN